jgi:hypothetical protein
MKLNTIQLSIQEPCHENWEAMTATTQGKFCASCQKTVTDFTKLSDHELIEIIQISNGNLCGRLTQSQLERVYQIQQKQSWGSKLYKLLASVLLLNVNNISEGFSQKVLAKTVQTDAVLGIDKISPIEGDSLITVYGKVTETDENTSVIGCLIETINTSKIYGVITDAKGNYTLTIPLKSIKGNTLTFEINHIGFSKIIKSFPIDSLKKEVNHQFQKDFVLENDLNVLTGVVCIINFDHKLKNKGSKPNKNSKK